MLNSFFHAVGRFIVKPQASVSAAAREVLHDCAVGCLLALGVGTGVGLAAGGVVSLLAWLNG